MSAKISEEEQFHFRLIPAEQIQGRHRMFYSLC